MTPHLRFGLLETSYALDHLLWCYSSDIWESPNAYMTSEDISVCDMARRTSYLIRSIIDKNNVQRGPRPAFTPPNAAELRRLEQTFHARRAEEERRQASDADEAARRAAREAERLRAADHRSEPPRDDQPWEEPSTPRPDPPQRRNRATSPGSPR